MTSALYLCAKSIKLLSVISVIKINLFFNEFFENTTLRLVIVSSVSPDLETTTKQEFFKFFIFFNSECNPASKLSKKNTFFLFFL